MADLHDQFFPDDVDEQIEEYAQDQSLATPDNRLIYDLHQLYQEDTHIIQRVWERLSNRLPEEHVQHAASSRSSFKKFEPITGPLPKVRAHGNLARLINTLVATLMIS